MNETPWGGGAPEVSVTLKASKEFSAPWIVVRGGSIDEVRRVTAAVAGLDAGELPLTDVVHNVSKHFQSVSTVGTLLGATVVSEETLLQEPTVDTDRKSTRLNSSHVKISYAVFCLKKKKHICAGART